jgi:hypothetical protein
MRKALMAWAVAGVVALSGTAGLVGCASGSPTTASTRPSASSLPEGLSILDARADWGTDSAFKENGHVVYLQTRVGPLKPQVYRDQFPNEPLYEMDARIVDEDGRTFTLVIGGDNIIDPSWAADIKAGSALSALDGTTSDMFYKMARDAGQAFKASASPDLADHIFHVANATWRVPSEDVVMQARATDRLNVAISNGAQVPFDTLTGNYLEGELYGECIFLCVGHHSTVWGWQGTWDSTSGAWNSWPANIVACNHGPCANSSSLSLESESVSGGSSDWTPAWSSLSAVWSDESSGSNSGYTSGHGCQTNYNWDTPPGHECNDDSAYELQQIHDSTVNHGYGGTTLGNGSNFCVEHGSKGNACSCSSSCNSCSGDWGFPTAP